MRLLRETLTNFKGIRSFTFEPGGQNVRVRGDNGSGKTTLLDGFLWVLLDKDSTGRKEFELKTLDGDGKTIPMLEHSVELVVEQDGERITLKKTLVELWVKARGAPAAEFTGHRTAWEINGVSVQKKEYDAAVARICDEARLRLLTDPGYFAGHLSWQERRRILLELCGDLTDAEVIATEAKLAELPSFLAGRTIDAFRKWASARKTLLNTELKTIPVRVDEVTRSLPVTEPEDTQALAVAMEQAKNELQAVERELTAGGADAGTNRDGERQAQDVLLAELARSQDRLRCEVTNAKTELQRLTDAEQVLDQRLNAKRQEWQRRDAEKLVWNVADACPTCGQPLPIGTQQLVRQKAQDEFDRRQSDDLARLSAEGVELAAEQAGVGARRKQLEDILATAESSQKETSARAEKLQAEIARLQSETATEPIPDATRAQQTTRRDACRKALDELNRREGENERLQQGQQRIADLMAREIQLAAEYAELERQTFLTEEFIRAKVSLLEGKINSRFHLARFRLFEQQVNGALNEVCEVLGPDLVPYNGGLNHAARINTGIDIINTLSGQVGFVAPLFVDNAEAVTHLIDTPAQVIRLVVSEGDPAMVVESESETENETAPVMATQQPTLAQTRRGPGF